MSTEITYLFGNPGTGKSTLNRLLDGHPNLAVSPVHDTLIAALTPYDPDFDITDEINDDIFNTIEFRKRLSSQTGYYKLEANQLGSHRTNVGSSGYCGHEYLSGFDFYDFEREWIAKTNEKKYFKPRELLTTIFNSLFSHWESYEYSADECEHIIGVGFCNENTLKYFLENIKNSKAIVVQRDPRGLAATAKIRNENFERLLSSGDIFRWIEYDNFVKTMKSKHENEIHTVNFRDLILNTDEEINKVAEFLEISKDQVLYHPTFAGKKLEEKYLGEIKDNWKDVLNEYEKNVVELQMGKKQKSDATTKELITYARSILHHNSRPILHLGKKGVAHLRS